MATTLLIKPIDVSKGTPLGGNIDVNKYVNVIKENQVFIIEPILGTKLYEKILTDFEADNLTGVYQTLVEDYIKNILVYTVAAEYILMSAYQVTNGGIFKHLPENSESVNKIEVDYLANLQRQKASLYIERLQDFLCNKSNEIPEYTLAQDENHDVKPKRNLKYTGGLRLNGYREVPKDAYYYLYKDIYESEGR